MLTSLFRKDADLSNTCRTRHSTANHRLLLDVNPPPRHVCAQSEVLRPLRAASPMPRAAALRALVGKYNPSAVCGDLPRNPGRTAESARQTPTGSPVA